MNWIKNLFAHHRKNDHSFESVKKEIFDKLLKFAKADPKAALGELNSSEQGLSDFEVKSRLKNSIIKTQENSIGHRKKLF